MQEATRSNCLKTIALPILIHSLLFKASAEHVLLKMLNSEPLHPACLRLKTLKNLPYLDTLPCNLSQIRECKGRGRHFQGSEVQYLLCAVKGRGGVRSGKGDYQKTCTQSRNKYRHSSKKTQQIKTYVTATNADLERFNIEKDGRDVRRDGRSCCGFFLCLFRWCQC